MAAKFKHCINQVFVVTIYKVGEQALEVNTRTVWIDNIRVMATIAVIVVHVATPAVFTKYNANDAVNAHWWVGNIYDSACRFCVPVFVMLTGALLLPQKLSLGAFLKKRLNRILLPFLFWSLIYLVFNFALKIRDAGIASAFSNWWPWLWLQIAGGAGPHLWYVYMIIGLYLFIPVIQPWIVAASNKAIVYFLIIWFITVLFQQQKVVIINSPFNLDYFSGYLGYLILGYFIAERLLITLRMFYGAAALYITGVAITVAGTYYLTYTQGSFSHALYEYLTLNVLFAATGVFIANKKLELYKNNAFAGRIRKFISRYGYGIYLSHLLIINILSHLNIGYSIITPAAGIPLTSLICIVLSAALVYMINKLPYGKYISG